MAYAALGAAEVLNVAARRRHRAGSPRGRRGHGSAPSPTDRAWPWPEPRLTYANAVLPEALLATGAALDDELVLRRRPRAASAGSSTSRPSASSCRRRRSGAGRSGEPRPGFDQQPIEVAALAEACARAYQLTGDAAWALGRRTVRRLVPRRQRQRRARVRPGDRRRLRRAAARRASTRTRGPSRRSLPCDLPAGSTLPERWSR